MRIVYVYSTLASWGGVERILVDKMNQLARLYNYDIYILTYNQGSHKVPYLLDERVCHVDLKVRTHVKYSYRGLRRLWEGFRRHYILSKRMKKAINNIAPNVIITTTSGELSLLLTIKGQIPLVVESHGGYDHLVDFPSMNWLHRYSLKLIRKQLKQVDAIVALTESDARKWRKNYQRVYVVPNIVHINPIDQYSSGEQKHIIFVGRFSEQKGIPELLTIWKIVYEKHPDWVLDIFGQGDRGYFPKGDNGLNVYEPTEAIFEKYTESSMLVLTSRWEPFGLVIPEAMSCGLPVISFEGDGPCSIITDGYDGFIVKNRSIENFADRLCLLMDNKELRQQMGKNAIISSQRYKAEKIMPIWKNLMERLGNK